MKTALITGITGQDGSYLAEFLIEKGYSVHGMVRRCSSNNVSRISHILERNSSNFKLHYGELEDLASLCSIINSVQPHEIYNLGCQSHVKVSFETPLFTSDVAGIGLMRILESVRILKLEKLTRIYQASSSEMFGSNADDFKNETTPFDPCSPYGIAKLFAHHTVNVYREAYGIFVCSGILFNHESPRRNEYFVTKKISRAVARIFHKKQETLELGNLEAIRDWGHAKDYVKAMWLMLQQEHAQDFVIATGKCCTVRDFTEMCFQFISLKITWHGSGLEEVGKDQHGVVRVTVSAKHFRGKEVPHLKGDSSKARRMLGWTPQYDLKALADEMVSYDIECEK